jgi:hypothetical protein
MGVILPYQRFLLYILALDNKQCISPKGTECGANAECVQSKCRCSAGFKMNVDTCVADNGGIVKCNIFVTPKQIFSTASVL